MPTRNVVHKNAYFDSVALMRVAARLNDHPGVEAASLMMGTESNREILRDADLLAAEGKEAGPNDLVVAVRGEGEHLDAALEVAADSLLGGPATDSPAADGGSAGPRRLVDAPAGANLAMISTPGRYAAAEAFKALRRGMHTFIFSDNVPVAQEVQLKQEAATRGLLVMGPDCGTAIINGHPLGFANAVRPGDVGLIGASGTGLQQVSTLLHALGAGVSQVIGVGSHDLSTDVGGLSMLTAFDALANDPATRVIVLVSKPPAPEVAKTVLERAARSDKPVVVNFLGGSAQSPAPAVTMTRTLRETARAAAGLSLGKEVDAERSSEQAPEHTPEPAGPSTARVTGSASRRLLRALYAGGTFAYEAAVLLEPRFGTPASTVPDYRPGTDPVLPDTHTVLDLGDDRFTAGRPHPMIDPATRVEFLQAAVAAPDTAVVLVDVVLGHGAAEDPAGALVPAITAATRGDDGPAVVAFVVGTQQDPQDLSAQEAALRQAGALVVDSSTTAVEVAADIVTNAEENR